MMFRIVAVLSIVFLAYVLPAAMALRVMEAWGKIAP